MKTLDSKNGFPSLRIKRPKMSSGLIGLHVLIITIYAFAAYFVLPWNAEHSIYKNHLLECSLFAIPIFFTSMSLLLNFGWWIPLAMIGFGIMSIEGEMVSSGGKADLLTTRLNYQVCGIVFGTLIGFLIELSIRKDAVQ